VIYPPDVLIGASAGYFTQTDDQIIRNEVQSNTYDSWTQTVAGISFDRGDYARDTPGGRVHTATIVCRPKNDAYAYSITLNGRDESFQQSFQT
jgi:hypothetical protein